MTSRTSQPTIERDDKIRENRLRRAAQRQGLRLTKSRRRDYRAVDYETYGLITVDGGVLVAGDPNHGYGLTLDQIERELG